ncbi:hypothetical protein ACWCYZ_17520 [Streptomyces virginiae]
MSEEKPVGGWVDPRYREVVTLLGACQTVRGPGRRYRKVCPHGEGVTVIVDTGTGKARNVACAAC